MSRRIKLKKLAPNVKESKGYRSVTKFTPAVKEVVIGEKHPQEVSNASASKKGKSSPFDKGKGPTLPLATQKKAMQKVAKPSSKEAGRTTSVVAIEDTSINPIVALGPKVTILRSNLDGQVAQLRVQNQQAFKELAKVKDEQDVTADKLGKMELLVAELRDREARSKKLDVEEFKSSNEFQDVIEMTSSRYFGEGFDFYKRRLHRHRPDLGIDLEGMGINQDLLEEEEEELEQEEERVEEERRRKRRMATIMTTASLLSCIFLFL
ncbi:DNA double-strand break repair Rad50 ATPase [Actinidia chinensis var. chinensis]|uniref:DNA double-strand break repair Rad50 ATPase n=1 Tax=Actinidia chinensis var. chinensis TaxID=1590841 RepID=A0A2R6QGN3_ACTCC|nr:DNA double-strand break repair Rad50 ATPase [Actinidia chinensis var. chinensis]